MLSEVTPGITAALANLRRAQERLDCWPRVRVEVNGQSIWLGRGTNGKTMMAPNDAPTLKCTLDTALLDRILRREVHWNSAELACLIRFHRTGPYNPDVHTLLCFLHE